MIGIRARGAEVLFMGRHNCAVQAAIAQRRTEAVSLRVAGVGWPTIARKLAADPAINSDGRAYP